MEHTLRSKRSELYFARILEISESCHSTSLLAPGQELARATWACSFLQCCPSVLKACSSPLNESLNSSAYSCMQLEFGSVDFLDTHQLRQRLSENASRVKTRVQQVGGQICLKLTCKALCIGGNTGHAKGRGFEQLAGGSPICSWLGEHGTDAYRSGAA